jgi:hypothetical protein
MGFAARRRHEVDAAIGSFQKAIALDPREWCSSRDRGEAQR